MSGVNAAALQIAATGSGAPVRTLTSLFPDKAAGRGKLCASLGEGFILDAASERAAISLDLFGGQVHDPFLAANSDTSFSTSFNTSRATLSFGKKAGRQAAVSLAGASSALIGEIHLGGCSLEFPAREHGVKTYTTVALLSGSKEIGSVSLGCAYFVEEDYSQAAALEAALPHVAPYADTLNVMRRANAAAPALWRKYYAVLDRSGLMLYDLEYRAHRPAVAYLEPCDIVGVAKADWAKMSAAHSLALAVSSTYVRRADAWAQSALEDEDDETPILYVAADSRERMTAWREAIEALVSYGRHKAMQQG
ncbi:hypothetical protein CAUPRSCDRAFT_12395 [Caulochytrium protostelioides]|uniref:PH domain-containing protein n=1 Tax=Caulochytrium protostelioides TaxID=1555241 RepID=A0A4P9WRZ5_9FUNG|nr:hypothetical protein CAUPRSCDRAFT_12395 [Caulochytrium protostelioides]